MDALLRVGLVALLGCTTLEPGDDMLDGGPTDTGPDVFDAGMDAFDAFDACADPPIGDCPPLCMRPRITAGRALSGVGNIISGNLMNEEEWTCDNIWVLEDDTYVDTDVTLTIGPGTLVEAAPGVALVVRDRGRLVVEGERDAPVVIRPPSPYEVGDEWRGLYMLGDALVLDDSGDAERRDVNRLDATRSTYGVDNAAMADASHDCGSLRYLRIEFAGGTPDDTESEALFLGGCGTETEIDYVQVHQASDDAIVIYGGGFDLRHIMVTTSDADALQCERGWNGTIQYYVAHMPPASDFAVLQAEGPVAGPIPFSNSVVANMTSIATSTDRAVIVEGSSLVVGNSIAIQRELFMRVRDDHVSRWGLDQIEVRNSVLFTDSTPFFDPAALNSLYAPMNNGNNGFSPMLPESGTDPLITRPSWRPPPGTPATTTHGALPEGVDATDYAGAIDPDPGVEEWTSGWTYYLAI